MSRRKHPGKPHKRDKSQYVGLPYAMLKDPAFMALSSDAVRVLIQMHLVFHGMNNGQISFSTRQAMQCLQSGSERAKRALDQLQVTGFIVCHAQSSFTMKTKKAREWEITFRPMPNGPPSHLWKKNDGSISATDISQYGTDE
jgi:hypothetical protein